MIEHDKVIGPSQEEREKINERVKNSPPSNKERNLKTEITAALAGLMVAVAACSPKEIEAVPTSVPTSEAISTPDSTEEVNPTKNPSPEPSPTTMAEATVQAEGPIIEGQSVDLGGANAELVQKDWSWVTERLNTVENGWKVVTDKEGMVSSFIGQETVFIPQGPPGFKWNKEAGVWTKGNEVVVTEVVPPGHYDEESGQGGALATPDFATLVVDEQDEYKAVVFYGSEKSEQIREMGADIAENEGLQELPDGALMYVSGEVNKNFALNEGESIQRNQETGALEITNQEGQVVRRMELRWSQVESQQEAENLGKLVEVEKEFGEIITYVESSYTDIINEERVEGLPDGVPIPDLHIASHPSIFNRDKEPVIDYELNTEASYDNLFEDSLFEGKDQLTASELLTEAYYRYMHVAWQSDKPEERGNVSFSDYVDKIQKGEDVSIEVNAHSTEDGEYEPRTWDPINNPLIAVFSERAYELAVEVGNGNGLQMQVNDTGSLYIERTAQQESFSERVDYYVADKTTDAPLLTKSSFVSSQCLEIWEALMYPDNLTTTVLKRTKKDGSSFGSVIGIELPNAPFIKSTVDMRRKFIKNWLTKGDPEGKFKVDYGYKPPILLQQEKQS